jgi:tankyrase
MVCEWLNVLQVAEYLLEQGADVNAQDKGGLIPLHNASSYGHLDIAALLIKYNTIVNATGNITATKPLL